MTTQEPTLIPLLRDLLDEHSLSDQGLMELHDAINWEYTDYGRAEDFVDALKAEIQTPGTAESNTVVEALSDFMIQNSLDNKAFIDLYSRVAWDDANDEDFQGLLRKLESVINLDTAREAYRRKHSRDEELEP